MLLPWREILGQETIITYKTIWPFYVLIGLIIIGKLIYILYERQYLIGSGIKDIDNMNGWIFEKYLEKLFNRLGYEVERTRYINDYGTDLVVIKNRIKIIIKAKRYNSKVGVSAVQEALASKGFYDCYKAMVVTNGFYTKQAINLARANRVELWDRNDLVKALLSAKEIDIVESELP